MATNPKRENSSKKPEFLKQLEQDKFDINEYLKSVLGREPYVNNAKRRWRFLISFCKFVYENKKVNFVTVIRWFARNCEVMKRRTIKESYIEYLEMLGVIEWNENSKMVIWKGDDPLN